MTKSLDLINERFGKLLVIEKDTNRINGKGTYWFCKCDCGKLKSVQGSKLVTKNGTKSCGCLREKLMDISGQRYDRLVVEKFLGFKNNDHHKPIWLCLCDCGKRVEITSYNLRRKNTRSCGCIRFKEGDFNFSINKIIKRYKNSAEAKDMEWLLTKEQVIKLCTSNCFYCGKEPSNIYSQRTNDNLYFSGIDRKNNENGYTIENVVSACAECNFAKGFAKYDRFINWIERLVFYQIQIKGLNENYNSGK